MACGALLVADWCSDTRRKRGVGIGVRGWAYPGCRADRADRRVAGGLIRLKPAIVHETVQAVIETYALLNGRAGLPTTVMLAATSLVTTDPMPTIASWPIRTRGRTVAPAATQA